MGRIKAMLPLVVTIGFGFALMTSPVGVKVAMAQLPCYNGGTGYCAYGDTPCSWCYDGTLYGCDNGDFEDPAGSCNPCGCGDEGG